MSIPTLGAVAGAAIIALTFSTVPAAAQTVEALELQALPTQTTVSVAGKGVDAVRADVRHAAHFVCRNATRRGELDLVDFGWCAFKSSAKAMKVYHTAQAEGRLASNEAVLVLSSR